MYNKCIQEDQYNLCDIIKPLSREFQKEMYPLTPQL